jgi:hypothetical protein
MSAAGFQFLSPGAELKASAAIIASWISTVLSPLACAGVFQWTCNYSVRGLGPDNSRMIDINLFEGTSDRIPLELK